MMSIEEIRERIAPILEKWRVRRASVFGSYARGEADDNSDVDILVELSEDMSLMDLVELKLEIEDVLGKRVDLVEFDALKPSIRESVMEDQVALT